MSASNARTLILVRHCETASQHPDSVLTEVGVGQAQQLSFDDPHFHAPGGESAIGTLCRVRAALGDILDEEHRLPLVVTHGNVMALLLQSVDASFGYQGWKSLTIWILSERPNGSRAFQRVWRA